MGWVACESAAEVILSCTGAAYEPSATYTNARIKQIPVCTLSPCLSPDWQGSVTRRHLHDRLHGLDILLPPRRMPFGLVMVYIERIAWRML